MTTFKTNIKSQGSDFHVFATDDKVLQNIGMASYDVDTIKQFLETPVNNPDTLAYFDGNPPIYSNLTGKTAGTHPISIFKFNVKEQEYQYEQGNAIFTTDGDNPISVATDVEDFLTKYRRVQLGFNEANSGEIIEIAQKIQNSISGCITFMPPPFRAQNCDVNPVIRLYVRDRGSPTGRSIAQKGAPIITDIPRRVTGPRYGNNGTRQSGPGIYTRPDGNGIDNPANTVAAPLSLHYNDSIGAWESGTRQVLAKLLTDLDPADSKEIGKINKIEKASDFYSKNGAKNLSAFTTGIALPLTMENGNPYKYGPNLIGCKDSEEGIVEKIVVVNRSSRSFKTNDLVICSYISGEWIVMGFDAPKELKKPAPSIGRLDIQKYIVNSIGSFKLHKAGDFATVTPNQFEGKYRNKYYTTIGPPGVTEPILANVEFCPDPNELVKINVFITDTVERAMIKAIDTTKFEFDNSYYELDPGNFDNDFATASNGGYIRCSTLQQLPKNLGGFRDKNFLGRTNILYSPDGKPTEENFDYVYAKQIPTFWGCLYTDGYKLSSVSKFQNDVEAGTLTGGQLTSAYKKIMDLSLRPATSLFNTDSAIKEPTLRMFYDVKDNNFKQFPPELALNGPSLPYDRAPSFSLFGSTDDLINDILNPFKRYHYIASNSGNAVYDFEPLSPGKIQFSPLTLEMLLSHSDIFPGVPLGFAPEGLLRLKTNMKFISDTYYNVSIVGPDGNNPIFMKDGNIALITEHYKLRNPLYGTLTAANGAERITSAKIPYGFMLEDIIKKLPSYNENSYRRLIGPAPLGGVGYLTNSYIDESSNVSAIIAAKTTIGTNSQSLKLTFNLSQYFGLTPKLTVTGQGASITVLGMFLSWTNQGNSITQNSYPQWGDRTRNYSYDSFGSTSLHVKAMNTWPKEQTLYYGKYFSVFHFNPFVTPECVSEDMNKANINELKDIAPTDIRKYTIKKKYPLYVKELSDVTIDEYGIASFRWKLPNTTNPPWNINQPIPAAYNKYYEVQETSVDIRVPSAISNLDDKPTILSVGSIVDASGICDGKKLLPKSDWRINPIRRGRLLTGGGFRYYTTTLGITDANIALSTERVNGETRTIRGTGYKRDDKITLGKESQIKITGVDGTGGITSFTVELNGKDFVASDIGPKKPAIQLEGTVGNGAKFDILNLIVVKLLGHDFGPDEAVPITRLSDKGQDDGKKEVDALKTVEIELTSTKSTGGYDLFFFFQNDPLHTLAEEVTFIPGFAQFINVEIA